MVTTLIRRGRAAAMLILLIGTAYLPASGGVQTAVPAPEAPATSDKRLLDRARVLKRPALTSDARNLGLSGTVAVRVTVDSDGEVVVARAVTGPEGLRQAASRAARSWEFAPIPDPDPVTGFVVFRFSTGDAYGSIVGLREQDVASGPTRVDGPEETLAVEPASGSDPPAAAPSSGASRPREVGPTERIASSPLRLAPAALTALATKKASPRYPSAATSARIEGVVIVEVEVDEAGRVTGARAVSGHGILRPAAIDAARNWQFQPTLVDGAPSKVIGTLAFHFRL